MINPSEVRDQGVTNGTVDELNSLRERLGDKELRAREVASVLPQAIKLSRAHGEELARAFQPTLEESIRESIEQNPQKLVDALHPILGPMVRRSLTENGRQLLQSANQTLDQMFSWHGLRWRLEAWRTGKSFAEIVMLRSLVFRVEQIFLVHRETSLSLLHVAADAAVTQDSDMVAGMLSAILDFARDSFKTGESAALEEFRIGEMQVWIAPGPHAYLAGVIRGNPTRELRTTLEEAIDNVHIVQGAALANFDGDASVFESLRPELESCLRAQYQSKNAKRPMLAWFFIALAVALVVLGAFLGFRDLRQWRDFVKRLKTEPGVAVTSADHHWFRPSQISGLRDPLAADGAAIAKELKLDPARIRFDWTDYLALDPVSVRRRFGERFGFPKGAVVVVEGSTVKLSGPAPHEWLEAIRREGTQVPGVVSVVERDATVVHDPFLALQRFKAAFPMPPTVKAVVANGTLNLAGTAPYEWVAQVREGAVRIPGITAISGDDLQVEFDPKLVQQRFEARFGLPATVNASMQNGSLILSGEAPHAWLDRVRRSALEIPGLRALDDRKVDDVEQRAFHQSKSVIESADIYFPAKKDDFDKDTYPTLSRLAEEIRRCVNATQRMGVKVNLEVRGYADAVGAEVANADLGRRRAEAVRDFLVSAGLDRAMIKPSGAGDSSPMNPGEERPFEKAGGRAALRVVIQPSVP